MEDLISVVINVYNDGEYLRDCIMSVISQTYRNMEIIIVDDGSTDSSSRICDELLISNSKMKVHHGLHVGLADSRNKGIELASGKYITFLNGCDKIDNNYLQNLALMVNSYNVDIAMCSTYNESKNYSSTQVILFDSEDALRQLLIENNINNTPCGKVFARSLFDAVKFSGDNADTVYQLIEKSSKIAFMNNQCYYLKDFPVYPINSCLNRNLKLMKSHPDLSIYCKCDIVRNIQNEFFDAISNNRPMIDEDSLYNTFLKIVNSEDANIAKFFDYVRKAHMYLLANSKQNYKIVCPVLPDLY